MVSSCIVPSCKRRRRTGLSYYRFPVKDAERCKLWLRAVNNPKYDEDTAVDCLKNHRVCSLHFKPEDFERHLVWEAMGGDGVRKLRPTAVPSLNLDHGETSTCVEQVRQSRLSSPVFSSSTVSLLTHYDVAIAKSGMLMLTKSLQILQNCCGFTHHTHGRSLLPGGPGQKGVVGPLLTPHCS